MKNKAHLKKLHTGIGSMIKEIARRKRVSSETLANLILCYQENAGKIYKLDDMDSEHVVKISYFLEYNLLEIISKKYLSHIPLSENRPKQENCCMGVNMQTGKIAPIVNIGNRDFLKNIHVGQYIRKIAQKNGWNKQEDMAKHLQCSQSNISYLYKQKSLKLTTLIQISEVLKHNLIAEVYLSQMFVNSSTDDVFSCSTVTIAPQQICSENPNDENFLTDFSQQDDEK